MGGNMMFSPRSNGIIMAFERGLNDSGCLSMEQSGAKDAEVYGVFG